MIFSYLFSSLFLKSLFVVDKRKKSGPCVFFLIIVVLCNLNEAHTQVFQNINVSQKEDTVAITYDLLSKESYHYKVGLQLSRENGSTFDIIPRSVWGDIGGGIKPGMMKKIYWLPLKDSVELIGESFVFNLVGEILGASKDIEFVKVEGGSFIMGDTSGGSFNDARALHEVQLNDFEMSKYEVTNAQFCRFMNLYGSDVVTGGEFAGELILNDTKKGIRKVMLQNSIPMGGTPTYMVEPGYEYYPVINVTWYGANEFCRYYGYRLPSEAEWEYAARERGQAVKFGNGMNETSVSEINFRSFDDPHLKNSFPADTLFSLPVCSYKPNSLDLYDMSGNVWEWCQDWYSAEYYGHSAPANPPGPVFGTYKLLRGGSWFSTHAGIASTKRSFLTPYVTRSDVGFRIVRDVSN
jgi:formylglycine-generating enzyme required for sulfatase activity